MNLTYRQLRAFLAITRLKSFTRAAENLHITQQGLSLMIQQMERQLGSRLFDRTTRSVTLAPAGRQLLPVAEDVVARLENAALSIEQLSRQVARRLSVAATPFVASHLLPEVCRRFAHESPGVQVTIVDADRSRIAQLVESGEVDFGLGIFFKPLSGLHRRRLFKCELLCLERDDGASPDDIAPLPWAKLEGADLIGLVPDNPLQQFVDAQLARVISINPARRTFNHIPTILAMVEKDFGSAVLPSFTLAAVGRMALRARPLYNPVVPVNFYQLSIKGRTRSPAEGEFLRVLLSVLEELCAVPQAAPSA